MFIRFIINKYIIIYTYIIKNIYIIKHICYLYYWIILNYTWLNFLLNSINYLLVSLWNMDRLAWFIELSICL